MKTQPDMLILEQVLYSVKRFWFGFSNLDDLHKHSPILPFGALGSGVMGGQCQGRAVEAGAAVSAYFLVADLLPVGRTTAVMAGVFGGFSIMSGLIVVVHHRDSALETGDMDDGFYNLGKLPYSFLALFKVYQVKIKKNRHCDE